MGRKKAESPPDVSRILRVLNTRTINMEWPSDNPAFLTMIDNGLAEISKRYEERWNKGIHQCVEIRITDKGRIAVGREE